MFENTIVSLQDFREKNYNGQEICHRNCSPHKNDDCTVVGVHVAMKKGNHTITTLSSTNMHGYYYMVWGRNTRINGTGPSPLLLANLMFNNTQLPHIQGVTGGTDQISGECSLGQTIPI